MKKLLYISLLPFAFACNDDIQVDLPQTEALVAFDAWLYHQAAPQTIDIYVTNTYFDSSEPAWISDATVTITNVEDNSEEYSFIEGEDGRYTWTPTSPTDTFAIVGGVYYLNIDIDGTIYESVTDLDPVPSIDSITWRFEEADSFTDESYFANFWSRDLPGDGDTYWIKSWKNGVLLNKPSEINIAYDAAFSRDGNSDGLFFIQPIRENINPFDVDDDDEFIQPFELPRDIPAGQEVILFGQDEPVTFTNDTTLIDSIYVELNSISQEAFYFLQQVQIQTAREGGFGELFAVPLANIQSNIFSRDENEKVVGFFNISATSSFGRAFTEEWIRIPE